MASEVGEFTNSKARRQFNVYKSDFEETLPNRHSWNRQLHTNIPLNNKKSWRSRQRKKITGKYAQVDVRGGSAGWVKVEAPYTPEVSVPRASAPVALLPDIATVAVVQGWNQGNVAKQGAGGSVLLKLAEHSRNQGVS